MNTLSNIHASIFAYLSLLAPQLETLTGYPVTVVNFDSYTDMNTLPDGDVIGLGEFSLVSSGDEVLDLSSGIFMAGTVNDPNNMRLIKILNVLYDDCQPTKVLPYYAEASGAEVGILVFKGEAQVLPVEKGLSTKILQGVLFELAAINDSVA
jgi:hypothetical protein